VWLEGRDVVSLLELILPKIPIKSAPLLLPGMLKVYSVAIVICLPICLSVHNNLIAKTIADM
jgi:hypothetical protein